MEGILFVVDDQQKKRFVQIDLDIHGDLWDDFYDLILINSRKGEETVPYSIVKEELRKYGKL